MRRVPRPPVQPPPAHIVARHELMALQLRQQPVAASTTATEQGLHTERLRALRSYVDSPTTANADTLPGTAKPASARGVAARQQLENALQTTRPVLHSVSGSVAVHEQQAQYVAQPVRVQAQPQPPTHAGGAGVAVAVPTAAGQEATVGRRPQRGAPPAPARGVGPLPAPSAAAPHLSAIAVVGDNSGKGTLAGTVSRNRGLRAMPPPKKIPPIASAASSVGDGSDGGTWSTSSSDAEADDEVQASKALLVHKSAVQQRQQARHPQPLPARQSIARPAAESGQQQQQQHHHHHHHHQQQQHHVEEAVSRDSTAPAAAAPAEATATTAAAAGDYQSPPSGGRYSGSGSPSSYIIDRNPNLQHLQQQQQPHQQHHQQPRPGLPGLTDFASAVEDAAKMRTTTPKDDGGVVYAGGSGKTPRSPNRHRPQYVVVVAVRVVVAVVVLCGAGDG